MLESLTKNLSDLPTYSSSKVKVKTFLSFQILMAELPLLSGTWDWSTGLRREVVRARHNRCSPWINSWALSVRKQSHSLAWLTIECSLFRVKAVSATSPLTIQTILFFQHSQKRTASTRITSMPWPNQTRFLFLIFAFKANKISKMNANLLVRFSCR